MQYTEYLEKYLYRFDSEEASEMDVQKAEQQLGYTFPLAVRNFLLLTGNDYNDLLNDAGTSYLEHAVENQQIFQGCLVKYGITFTEPVFVISAYDECFFVKLSTGVDPETWAFSPQLFVEGDDYWPGHSTLGYAPGFWKHDDHFSAYLVSLVNQRLVDKSRYDKFV